MDAWVEASQTGLKGKVKRPERAWRRLLDMGKLLSIPHSTEDDDPAKLSLTELRKVLSQESEERLRDRLGIVELDKKEMLEVLRRRLDWAV